MATFERILVPTDFSESSQAAADLAAELARRLGSEVRAVTVVDTRPLEHAYGDEAFRYQRIEAIRSEAQQELDRFVGKHFAGCAKVEAIVRDGDAFSEILAGATDTGCDLIVMGTHGRTGLVHLLIGSVAEKVVRHAPIPVLTVRPPA